MMTGLCSFFDSVIIAMEKACQHDILRTAGGVFDGVFLCCPLSHEMSWMRPGIKLRQFLRVFLPTLELAFLYLSYRLGCVYI